MLRTDADGLCLLIAKPARLDEVHLRRTDETRTCWPACCRVLRRADLLDLAVALMHDNLVASVIASIWSCVT
jgi:hypothetical protein